MKKLKLVFRTSENRQHTFYPKVDCEKITPEEIQQIVTDLIILDQQQPENDIRLFDCLEQAVLVEKNTTRLFKKYKNAIIFYKE